MYPSVLPKICFDDARKRYFESSEKFLSYIRYRCLVNSGCLLLEDIRHCAEEIHEGEKSDGGLNIGRIWMVLLSIDTVDLRKDKDEHL